MTDPLDIFQSFLAHPSTKVLGLGARVYSFLQQHKEQRAVRRLEQVQKQIVGRVDKFDERITEICNRTEDSELFLSVLHALLEDDEDQKVSFYAAFLEHQLSSQTSRAELQVIAVAFRSLNSAELEVLADSTAEGRLPQINQDWLKLSAASKLLSLGLANTTPGQVVYGSRLTSLGLVARSIAQKAKTDAS